MILGYERLLDEDLSIPEVEPGTDCRRTLCLQKSKMTDATQYKEVSSVSCLWLTRGRGVVRARPGPFDCHLFALRERDRNPAESLPSIRYSYVHWDFVLLCSVSVLPVSLRPVATFRRPKTVLRREGPSRTSYKKTKLKLRRCGSTRKVCLDYHIVLSKKKKLTSNLSSSTFIVTPFVPSHFLLFSYLFVI